MVVLQPGEKVICEIKRHPFGLVSAYVAGLFAVVLAIVLGAYAPHFAEQNNYDGDIASIALAVVLIVTVGVAGILAIATYVYWQNRWIVTDDSITQVTQNSLLARRVSQLSMENLEDITVDQHGIIQTMFNFGTLKAETAGEHSKFFFLFCPDPNTYARKILEVHETFLYQGRHERRELSVDPLPHPYTTGQVDQPQQQGAPAPGGAENYQQPAAPQQQPQYAAPVDPTQTTTPQYATPAPMPPAYQAPAPQAPTPPQQPAPPAPSDDTDSSHQPYQQ